MKNIRNYLQISPTVISGGQPDREQLLVLIQNGVDAVINLGLSDADYAVKDEESILLDKDVAYIHIPVDFTNPEKKQLELFFEYMKKHSQETIFVHCAANKRAICFLSLWGEFYLSWSRRQAEKYVKEIWVVNGVWSKFLNQMRSEFGISS